MKPGEPCEPPIRAVVVNDDVTSLNLLTALLIKDGIEVLPFPDAEAALVDMASKGPPDLIVTDLYMPVLDGWRFCRLLRSPEYPTFNKIPILVVSATFSGDESAGITADLGANGFLAAPVDARQFIKHVRALLDGQRSREPLRVLIVEDSRTLTGILKKAFDAHGYETETALTVKAAYEAFSKSPWDIAVIDYHLPDGNGDELLQDFRERQRDCVCLMMTTDPAPELALQWMKKGAAAYLRKPFAPEYLIDLCDKTRRERALLRVQDLLEIRTRELQESEEQYRLLVENARDIIFRTDVTGHFTFANPAGLSITGYKEEEIIGSQYTMLLRPDKCDEALRFFGSQVIKGISNTYSEYPVLTKDGREFWFGQNAQLVMEGDRVSGFQIVARDITDRKRAEAALWESEEKYRNLFENAQEAIFVAQDGNLVFYNPMIYTLLGYPSGKLTSSSFVDYIHPDDRDMVIDRHIRRMKGEEVPHIYSFRIIHRDGNVRWVELNAVSINWKGKPATLNFLSDITERRQMEEKLRDSEQKYHELSIIDDLTKLYNSRHFYSQLKIEIDRVTRYRNQTLTLLLLDLDNFKAFNDVYGHVEGDQVLTRLGQVIKRCLRETDFAYRYGGEEFTILLPMTTSADGTVTAERIRAEFKKENFSPAPDKNIFLTASIGVAEYRYGEDIKDFVRRADKFMYQAKNDGKDGVCSEARCEE